MQKKQIEEKKNMKRAYKKEDLLILQKWYLHFVVKEVKMEVY